MPDDIFAIRCFRNGKRRKTHTLTKGEAKVFRQAARKLVRYLTTEYKLKPKPRNYTPCPNCKHHVSFGTLECPKCHTDVDESQGK